MECTRWRHTSSVGKQAEQRSPHFHLQPHSANVEDTRYRIAATPLDHLGSWRLLKTTYCSAGPAVIGNGTPLPLHPKRDETVIIIMIWPWLVAPDTQSPLKLQPIDFAFYPEKTFFAFLSLAPFILNHIYIYIYFNTRVYFCISILSSRKPASALARTLSLLTSSRTPFSGSWWNQFFLNTYIIFHVHVSCSSVSFSWTRIIEYISLPFSFEYAKRNSILLLQRVDLK